MLYPYQVNASYQTIEKSIENLSAFQKELKAYRDSFREVKEHLERRVELLLENIESSLWSITQNADFFSDCNRILLKEREQRGREYDLLVKETDDERVLKEKAQQISALSAQIDKNNEKLSQTNVLLQEYEYNKHFLTFFFKNFMTAYFTFDSHAEFLEKATESLDKILNNAREHLLAALRALTEPMDSTLFEIDLKFRNIGCLQTVKTRCAALAEKSETQRKDFQRGMREFESLLQSNFMKEAQSRVKEEVSEMEAFENFLREKEKAFKDAHSALQKYLTVFS